MDDRKTSCEKCRNEVEFTLSENRMKSTECVNKHSLKSNL